ncbi:hypothetical protein ACROYT_G026529 [Oculina patagonica]
MYQFFFIASQHYNGFVLDISTGKKGGNLVLWEAYGGPSQLWRWDEDCRLVSKLGLVADIKGKRKKAGTVCHAWIAHDGLNQKWRVEEGAIKSNLNDLVIDAATLPVTMHEVNDTPKQGVVFHSRKRMGRLQTRYSIDDYEAKVHQACNIMGECSSKLHQVAKDTGIARTVGGSASIIGGGMAIAGLVLAPFTAGASLGLTIAGVATGATGGVTSFGSSLVNHVYDKNEKKKVYKVTAPLFRATFSLQGFLKEYINNLREAADFLKTPEGETLAKDAYSFAKGAQQAGLGALHAYRVGDIVYTGVKHLKEAKRIKALVDFIEADFYVVKEARFGLATNAAAPGIRLFGKTIVAAGTTSAKALSGSLAGFGIAFGIWDIVGGAKKIKNGSELAEEFHRSSEHLRAESCRLIKLYKDLQ